MSYAARRQRLARQLKPLGLDALLVTHPVNVTYLTGFTGEASFLIVGRKRVLLVSDGRFTQQLAEECPGLDVHFRPPTITTLPATAKLLTELGFRAVGFESTHLTVAMWERFRELAPALSWAPTRRLVEAMRAVKDDDEVQQIREAIAVAERAYGMFRTMLNPDATERELVDALETYVRRAGGHATSFPSIVAVGERSALAHAPPTGRAVRSSDWLLLDWGAAGTYYKSDLTRLLVTRRSWFRPRPGRPRADDPKLAKVYTAVLAAQQRAIAAIRPGVPARDVDAAARSALAGAGYGDYFSHGLGHGLGLQVHEAPDLRASSEDVLQAGMVVTVEPGVYLPGWGGVRIEDDILVTPDGAERLSTLPRDFAAAEVPEAHPLQGVGFVWRKRPVAVDDASKSPRPFDVRTIKTLVGLMDQYDLSEIDLHEGDHRIRLRRGTQPAVIHPLAAPPPVPMAASPVATAPGANAAAPPPTADAKPKADKPAAAIKSPTPGTFYTSPSPDAAPFVGVGSRVTPQTVVCIIEAMKIFNEIQAECSGVITKVLVQNQQPVEYGQALFEVDPTG